MMAAVMALAAVVAKFGLERGLQEAVVSEPAVATP